MKKKISALIAAMAVAFSFADCSSDNGDFENSVSDSSSSVLENSEKETSETEEQTTVQKYTTEIISEASETTETSVTEPIDAEEWQTVEAVCLEMFGYNPEPDGNNFADYLVSTAKTIPERVLGEITSEDDAVEKARTVWIERLGAEYIEDIESEYVELSGERVKYRRDNPTYTVVFYEEYDAWYIQPNPPSGTTEDGRNIATPSMPPYLIIRGSDGKIIGALI